MIAGACNQLSQATPSGLLVELPDWIFSQSLECKVKIELEGSAHPTPGPPLCVFCLCLGVWMLTPSQTHNRSDTRREAASAEEHQKKEIQHEEPVHHYHQTGSSSPPPTPPQSSDDCDTTTANSTRTTTSSTSSTSTTTTRTRGDSNPAMLRLRVFPFVGGSV